MADPVKLSHTAALILGAIAAGDGYGFSVMELTGLPSGTVYPALRRMEDARLVVSRWENAAVAQKEQRPPRKYYELSKSGQRALADATSRYRLTERDPVRVGRPSPAKR